MSYPFHEAANLFPLLAGDRFIALCESIKRFGVKEAIVLFHGKVIDGRNRCRAVEHLAKQGIKVPLPTREFEGATDLDVLDYVLSTNIRRDISKSQRAAIAVRADLLAQFFGREEPEGKPAEDHAEVLARASGVNRSYIFKAKIVAKKSISLLNQVCAGKINIPQALAKVRVMEVGTRRAEQAERLAMLEVRAGEMRRSVRGLPRGDALEKRFGELLNELRAAKQELGAKS